MEFQRRRKNKTVKRQLNDHFRSDGSPWSLWASHVIGRLIQVTVEMTPSDYRKWGWIYSRSWTSKGFGGNLRKLASSQSTPPNCAIIVDWQLRLVLFVNIYTIFRLMRQNYFFLASLWLQFNKSVNYNFNLQSCKVFNYNFVITSRSRCQWWYQW